MLSYSYYYIINIVVVVIVIIFKKTCVYLIISSSQLALVEVNAATGGTNGVNLHVKVLGYHMWTLTKKKNM